MSPTHSSAACRPSCREPARVARLPGGTGSRKSGLGPRQEELLSYLQGLAPVGESFVLRRAEAMADLNFSANVVFYRALRKLIHAGCVTRLEVGRSHANGHLRVLRRLEAIVLEDQAGQRCRPSADIEPIHPEARHAPGQSPDFEPGTRAVSSSIPG